jgi:hypothetical protein
MITRAFERFAEHLCLAIATLLAVFALCFCGCGASSPEPTATRKPTSESEYRKRAGGIVVEVLGNTGRAAVSCEALQAWTEAKRRSNPAWPQNAKEARDFDFISKSLSMTNFYLPFLDHGFVDFVRTSPPNLNVLSNQMSLLNESFLRLRDAFVAEGFDEEWKAGVTQRVHSVYTVLSNVVTSLSAMTNNDARFPEACFRTSYRSPYQRRRVSITSTGTAPDERTMVEHVLRLDWLTGTFHQQISIDPEERVGHFQRIGPYVMTPLPTIRTNRTKSGWSIYTNRAIVVFLQEADSGLKSVFSDLAHLKDAEFKLGDCLLERKL